MDNRKQTMSENSKQDPSFVSSDIKVDGHIISTGTIIISGQVVGNVKAKNLTVESSGKITGNINADYTELMGTQKGNISSKKLSIFEGAKLKGNIKCDDLIVEHGAEIAGKVFTSNK